ncbi:MAG TPA: hypothetical protein HPP83_01540 [Candidatus Hydrogenedentes bacterium]|nr:hypothetical protein [Candidatus Hydrogenedentota bacterium]
MSSMPKYRPLPILRVWLILVVLCCTSVECNPRATPIGRALFFLRTRQVAAGVEVLTEDGPVVDYAGNWPQSFSLEGTPAFRIRDVSPFIVTFIHHALTHVVEENAAALGLTGRDVLDARVMRQRAVEFMRRFESGPGAADAGAFGFWPQDERLDAPQTLGQLLARDWLEGPVLMGDRRPVNLEVYPAAMAIPSDADVTATVYAALLDHAAIDGGAVPDTSIAQLFADWRDTGAVPLRAEPDWLPPQSGVFLTWLDYREAGEAHVPNDVDLVVNANVLYTLARYDRLDTPGVAEAVALINAVVEEGRHVARVESLGNYYPDGFAFHYSVSRAYCEGPVAGLRPAAERLAESVEQSAQVTPAGGVFWDKGAPHLDTALAVLTLMNASRQTPLIDKAVEYLIAEQDPTWGNWDEGAFFVARTDAGPTFVWTSKSLTIAFVLEALCQYELMQAQGR